MPWDARSRRVFLEIPDKSWCCYLAFDSFPCMEDRSSWFFLCSALTQLVLGKGLTPWHQDDSKAQLGLCTSLPRSQRTILKVHEELPRTHRVCSCQNVEGAIGQVGAGAPGKWEWAQLSHTAATTPWLEGGALLPDPRTHPWTAARPRSLISITEAPSPGSGLHRGV